MNPKRIERWSDQLKERVVRAHESGLSYAKISKKFEIPKTSVYDIVKRHESRGTVTNVESSGRPKKTSAADDRKIVIEAKKNPRITRR